MGARSRAQAASGLTGSMRVSELAGARLRAHEEETLASTMRRDTKFARQNRARNVVRQLDIDHRETHISRSQNRSQKLSEIS